MRLPPVRRREELMPSPKWLRQWLAERAAEKILAEDEPSAPTPSLLPAGPPPEPAQIRLLYPQLPGCAVTPRYVAVLSSVENERVWVAPFSAYSVPAVPSEWLAPRSAPPLRVLSLGFARPWPVAVLQQSWVVDSFSKKEWHQVQTAFKAWKNGVTELSEAAPLVHPLDPRHEYVEEELSWVRAVVSATPQAGSQSFPVREPSAEDLPLAAEPGRRKKPRKRKLDS